MKSIAVLKNPVQGYAWGSTTFIPQLLGEPSPSENPVAELWMGAHPKAPSLASVDGQWVSLIDLIQQDHLDILGQETARRFSNKMPFLFKVLAAARPLSIQAHPDKKQALEGFKRENGLAIPPDAPHRCYRDQSHKPEMVCALTPFLALKGFRKGEEMAADLKRLDISTLVNAISDIRKKSKGQTVKDFFSVLMTMKREGQRGIIAEAVSAAEKGADGDPLCSWVVKLNKAFPGDMGCLSPLFLNLVQLQPGEAMYLPAGELHAYLEGAAVELMANSDNVLRGGLTPKTIDIPELLKILKVDEGPVNILRPEKSAGPEKIYRTGAKEFVLSHIDLQPGSFFKSTMKRSVEVMLCVEGETMITDLSTKKALPLNRGTSIIIPAAVKQYRIEGKGRVFKATVPLFL